MQNFLCQMHAMKRQVPFTLKACHGILEKTAFWTLQFGGDKRTRVFWSYSDIIFWYHILIATHAKIMYSSGFLREYIPNLLRDGLLPTVWKRASGIWEPLAPSLTLLNTQPDSYMQNSPKAQYALYMVGEMSVKFRLVSSCLCVQAKIL